MPEISCIIQGYVRNHPWKHPVSKIKQFPFHPLLFAAYPIVALLAVNIDQIKSTAALRSLLITLAAAGIVWALLNLVCKDWHRAALLVSLYFILFFSYGHVYHFLETQPILGMALGRHRLLIVVWLLLAAGGTWAAVRKTRDPRKATEALNLVGLVLIAMPIVSMLIYTIRFSTSKIERSKVVGRDGQITLQSSPAMPDIYYIVLDGYTREDVLKEKFDLDNSAFITELEKMGFYVAHCSQSNYAFTDFSVTSTLHMDYMDKISERYLGGKMDLIWIPELLRENEVRRNLEQLGYRVVTFENDYFNLLWNDADVIYRKNSDDLQGGQLFSNVNGFEALLMRESAALVLTDSISVLANRFTSIENSPNNLHRDIILYMLDKLKQVPLAVENPKFVYAHFVAPHFPIVFGAAGEPVTLPEDADLETYAAGYRGEVIYLNKRILEIVREIIAVSATPPVIIIQGDHGDDKSEAGTRMKILNAYYLPGVDLSKLYPTISPVNSFRLIFDEYFGGNYALLPDRSFYSTMQKPLDYTEIPNSCVNGEAITK